jgi:glycosyltransferase involved in cell wall biosynthesis
LVVSEFPIGFSSEAATRAFDAIQSTVKGGKNFVTYSEHIKREVLIDRFHVPPANVHVIPHAPNSLEKKIKVRGFQDNDAASMSLARRYGISAMSKLTWPSREFRPAALDFTYIFFASQFRASKNIFSLLKAYRILLKERYLQHKLVLTGFPSEEIGAFIIENHMTKDVLLAHDLTEMQLAALYRCAELSIAPSLSEGGMPFTFAESVSVGTPVVMADIAVTREVMTDEHLRRITLFDPMVPEKIADKIEEALGNLPSLYASQRRFFDDVLSKRTWDDVVREHLEVLDRISNGEVAHG